MVTNIVGRTVQGGSTLTQQLAKNLFLSPERTVERKIQEVLLSFWLEHKFTKDQILAMYLNRVYFGSNAYGVEAASRRYFSKSARDVNLGEAALLAGLLKAPSRLLGARPAGGGSPRAGRRHRREEGFISEDEIKTAMSQPPTTAATGPAPANTWPMVPTRPRLSARSAKTCSSKRHRQDPGEEGRGGDRRCPRPRRQAGGRRPLSCRSTVRARSALVGGGD